MIARDEAHERDWNPSEHFAEETARRAALTASLLERVTPETVAYGPSERTKLDLFRPARPNGAVALYFHGGYWRGGSREASGFVAGPLIDAGITAFIAGYDLCPAVTLRDIMAQARAARGYVLAHAASLQLDVSRFLLIGSSAGANMVALMLLDGAAVWPAPPAAALITGVFDLEPVARTSINTDLRIGPAEIAAYSPLRRSERVHARAALAAVGGDESAPWREGVRTYARMLERDVPVTLLECPGRNHFSLSTALGIADDPLTRAVIALV
jgi:arylformamidase